MSTALQMQTTDKPILHQILQEYDRITQILRPFSGLSLIDPEILNNAAARGTAVHKIIDSLAGGMPIFDEEIEKMVLEYSRNPEHAEKEIKLVEGFVKSYSKWAEGKKFKKLDRLYCTELMITGELDQIYTEKGKTVLVDFKTPISASKTWLLQASAYEYLATQAGHRIDRVEFVRLSRTGGKAKVDEYTPDFPLFKSALDTYRYFFKESGKEIVAQTTEDYL